MENKRYLITDKEGSVMAWSEVDSQVCYCGHQLPAKFYTKSKAQSYIKRSRRNRIKWGMEGGIYKLQRIEVSDGK